MASDLLPPRFDRPRELAHGGMGELFLARDTDLDRDVVVKLLARYLADDPSLRARFTREAHAAARLSGHPNVVTIYDVGEWSGRPFIVMEHVADGTVANRIAAGRIAREDALRWLEDAARALDAAHSLGVVHRDVKPANLLLGTDGRVRVADFGIARVADHTAGMTATGTILGTAGYLSPEQATGGRATPASDVYALAVVAYELLCGRRPFERESAAAEAAAHANDPVPPVPASAGLPPAVDAALARGLAKDPRRRPESAEALVDGIRTALSRGDATTQVLVPPDDARRRRGAGLALVGALLVAALAAGAVLAAVVSSDDDTTDGSAAPAAGSVTTVVTERETVEVTTTVPSAAPPPEPLPPAAPEPDARTLNDQGFALMNEGRYEEALPLLEESVRRLEGTYSDSDPHEAWAHYNLGFTLLALGRCEEAIGHLDRSASLQGDRKEIDRVQKEAERCLGRTEKADEREEDD